MIGFLKEFFLNEKSAEEQALMATQKKRDVITLDAYALDEEEEQSTGCGSGCGGCACR